MAGSRGHRVDIQNNKANGNSGAGAGGGASPMVLAVDPHPLVLAGLRAVCGEVLTGARFYAAQTIAEADKVIANHGAPTVLLVEPTMLCASETPNDVVGAGLRFAVAAKAAYPNIVLVCLSDQDHPVHVRRALAAGASAFVSKGAALAVLANAIRRAVQGEKLVCFPTLMQTEVSTGMSAPVAVRASPVQAVACAAE
jgi:two-component system response regulator DesR